MALYPMGSQPLRCDFARYFHNIIVVTIARVDTLNNITILAYITITA